MGQVELSDDDRYFAMTILSLVVAAGGRIVLQPLDRVGLPGWKLIVTESVASGVKIYEAVRVEQHDDP